MNDFQKEILKLAFGQQEERNSSPESFPENSVGQSFFFRTVTYHVVGKITGFSKNFIKLEEASWIPDSGRFMQFLKEGKVNEVEPVGICFLNLDSVVDFFPWKHELPKEQV